LWKLFAIAMSLFSKKGVLMVYSNDECGEEGGAEEALTPFVISEVQDALEKAKLAPVTHPPPVAKKYFDDDDVCIKLSDLPDNYFDDLLDFDFSAPAKKPKMRQLILLGTNSYISGLIQHYISDFSAF
jgi:hypothetical protein